MVAFIIQYLLSRSEQHKQQQAQDYHGFAGACSQLQCKHPFTPLRDKSNNLRQQWLGTGGDQQRETFESYVLRLGTDYELQVQSIVDGEAWGVARVFPPQVESGPSRFTAKGSNLLKKKPCPKLLLACFLAGDRDQKRHLHSIGITPGSARDPKELSSSSFWLKW